VVHLIFLINIPYFTDCVMKHVYIYAYATKALKYDKVNDQKPNYKFCMKYLCLKQRWWGKIFPSA